MNKEAQIFYHSTLYRSFQYQLFVRINGYQIDEKKLKSTELHIDTELLGITISKNELLTLQDFEELRLLLGLVDPLENINEAIKKVVYRVEHIKLRMDADKTHARPHFHIVYKQEYSASYSIDTLENLEGKMPKKYEDVILKWASTRKNKLLDIWKSLQEGKHKDVERLIYEAKNR